MSDPLATVLTHLEALVGFDTQNPPRNLRADAPLFDYLARTLGDEFTLDLADHGRGRIAFYARRGEPRLLFNVHLDTVPVLPGSRHPPLQLTREGERVHGRGACDIKGAAACLLAVAAVTTAPLALLFTTDEEGGEGCCVERFIASGAAQPFRQVVVAEPTGGKAEFRHRGFLSARGTFSGVGGHSSEARALGDNAIHRLARWCAAALGLATQAEQDGRRACFNIGTVAGGVKSNVIADSAEVFWSARLAPGETNEDFLERLQGLDGAEHAEWRVSFSGPPLPTAGHGTDGARAFAARHGLDAGEGLDFWTEASLFAAAGIPALVLGPGHIAQAHAVDEWVSLDQLARVQGIYRALVTAHE